MDFAARAHAHNYRLDPIARSRLDTDFYKLAMGALIDEHHPETEVTFALANRTKAVRLAEIVSLEELREQLDHARTLRYQPSELIYLQGQTFYGVEGLFKPSFIHRLRLSRLPDYELSVDADTGQFIFRTTGRWGEVTDWEIHLLAILNELRSRAVMRGLSRSQLDILYARAKVRLYAKLERLAGVAGLTVSDFGTRRRHGFLWQEHCVLTAAEVLGRKFVGTSNVLLAMRHDLEPRGTNAHELSMVYAALAAAAGEGADADEAIRQSQYRVLKDWQATYGDRLRILLPDTFGSTQFLGGAPDWAGWWTGARPDSKEPVAAGEELAAFWERMGQDPATKLCIFADGLDVAVPGVPANGADIVALHERFRGRLNVTFGWGTNLTNDFRHCLGQGDPLALAPVSIVCKVAAANGHPAVKLSDTYSKAASASPAELARYRRIFGADGVADRPVSV